MRPAQERNAWGILQAACEENRRYSHSARSGHVQMPNTPERDKEHGEVRAYVEGPRRHVETVDVQTFAWDAGHPNLFPRSTGKKRDEKVNYVEYGVQQIETLQYPIKGISDPGAKQAEHQEKKRVFDAQACWAVNNVQVICELTSTLAYAVKKKTSVRLPSAAAPDPPS